jgi:predicted dehydrogenase/nucleoside-diphosphate-sugar epimerase
MKPFAPPTFRVGLVGAGFIAPYHIRALKDLRNVRIVGVCDLDQPRAAALIKASGLNANVFPSLKAMVADGVDVVHILTPPSSHAALTLEALSLGCHVLVEKPLATRVEDCDRIIAAAKVAGKFVCVNHSLLRDPFVVRALNVVRSGAIGDVVAVDYLRSSDYPPYRGGPLPPQYREGGYPFRDLGVHALYLMEAFLGNILDVESRYGAKGSDPNLICDEWRALVVCERGMGNIQLSWNTRPMQNVLIVQGTRGVLRADLFSLSVTVKKTTPLPKPVERVVNTFREAWQVSTQVPLNVIRFLQGKFLPYHGVQVLIAEFYHNLSVEAPAPVTPEHARPIVAWTERVAREADAAKEKFLDQFPRKLKGKVLVTGASGFIGKRLLARLLEEHDRVRVLVRRQPPASWIEDSRIEIVFGDLGDPSVVERAVAGTEIIYHLGAAMGGAPHDFERGTLVGTRNIVEMALKYQVPKLVYVSSLAVLHAAAARKGKPMREDFPLEPHANLRGWYTQAKLDAELVVTRAVKQWNLRAVILRPGQVFGPGAPLLTPAVARRVRKNLIVLGNGKLVLPLVYVDDVVDGILRAGKSEHFDGSIFHLVDSADVTQMKLAVRYLKAVGENRGVICVPRFVAYSLALGVQLLAKALGRSAPLSIYRLQSVLAPISFDCSAAEQKLGWHPQVGVEEGLKITLDSLKPSQSP